MKTSRRHRPGVVGRGLGIAVPLRRFGSSAARYQVYGLLATCSSGGGLWIPDLRPSLRALSWPTTGVQGTGTMSQARPPQAQSMRAAQELREPAMYKLPHANAASHTAPCKAAPSDSNCDCDDYGCDICACAGRWCEICSWYFCYC